MENIFFLEQLMEKILKLISKFLLISMYPIVWIYLATKHCYLFYLINTSDQFYYK